MKNSARPQRGIRTCIMKFVKFRSFSPGRDLQEMAKNRQNFFSLQRPQPTGPLPRAPPMLARYRPSHRHPAVPTCSLGKPGPIIGSAATGSARSAVGGSFPTCLAEHRARATGVSLFHRPDKLLFNNSATRALYDQDVHLLEAWVCQRVCIKVVEGGFRDSSARSG